MSPNVPILAWAPDADPTTPGVLSDIENMLPTQRGYVPEPSLGTANSYSLTLSSAPHSGQTITYKAGSIPFVATGAKLSAFLMGGWADVARTASTYATASVYNRWAFDAFSTPSNDRVALAVQFENKLQQKSDSTAGPFSDVTAAPRAETMAVQRNFVLLGYYGTAGGEYADGWICSALEDHTNWTPDIATQCARGRLTATPGQIIRLIAFQDYVIAFKRRSMYRGTYVGAADNTWSWPVLSRSVGLVSRDAVCEAQGELFWLGYDGFYRFDGGTIRRINSAPWQWFLRMVSYGATLGTDEQCAWDPAQRVVRWLFSFPVAGTTNRLVLSYHPATDRWGQALLPVSLMMTMPSSSVYMPASASFVYHEFATAWFVPSGGSYVLSTQKSASASSSFTTSDIGDDDRGFALTRARARFLSAPSSSSMTHYYRMNLDDALTTGETVARSDGKYDVSHTARWHRLKFAQTGPYEVTGFSVESPKAGKR